MFVFQKISSFCKLFIVPLGLLLFCFTFLAGARVQAIHYGQPENGYEPAGYMLIEVGSGLGLCGVTFVSPSVAVTAAHCLSGSDSFYLATGQYSTDYSLGTTDIQNYQTVPGFKTNTGSIQDSTNKDVGLVVVSQEFALADYADISRPSLGCDYYMVGYGRDETGGRYDRKGLETCIENIDGAVMELSFDGQGFFCTGDSGSGIFRRGTNEIVGVISAFDSPTDCANPNTKFYATSLYAHKDFIQTNSPEQVNIKSSGTNEPARQPASSPNLANQAQNSSRNFPSQEESADFPLWLIFVVLGFLAAFVILVVIIIVLLVRR